MDYNKEINKSGLSNMGDNCNNSEDSRYVNIGNISDKEISGKIVFRISPRSEWGFVK